MPMYIQPEFSLWCLGIGMVTWMIGRGVRYIFSGE